jgi:hypothetical protein
MYFHGLGRITASVDVVGCSASTFAHAAHTLSGCPECPTFNRTIKRLPVIVLRCAGADSSLASLIFTTTLGLLDLPFLASFIYYL